MTHESQGRFLYNEKPCLSNKAVFSPWTYLVAPLGGIIERLRSFALKVEAKVEMGLIALRNPYLFLRSSKLSKILL